METHEVVLGQFRPETLAMMVADMSWANEHAGIDNRDDPFLIAVQAKLEQTVGEYETDRMVYEAYLELRRG